MGRAVLGTRYRDEQGPGWALAIPVPAGSREWEADGKLPWDTAREDLRSGEAWRPRGVTGEVACSLRDAGMQVRGGKVWGSHPSKSTEAGKDPRRVRNGVGGLFMTEGTVMVISSAA
jgi:hypothetical protein